MRINKEEVVEVTESKQKSIRILGTRGIPAAHGGFETFAQDLALFLVERGWKVVVYCQVDSKDQEVEIAESIWQGVELVHIAVKSSGALGTIIFDWKATCHAVQHKDLVLVLGYNTAVFSAVFKFKGVKSLMNMDGLEWKRKKYTFFEKCWLYLNERMGVCFSDHLIADHPEIKNHLSTKRLEKKITMIPYGAYPAIEKSLSLLDEWNLQQGNYAIVIARPEPENSILEIVRSFSILKTKKKLVILGSYSSESNDYHKQVFEAAGENVVFLGAIYELEKVNALRQGACVYIHGHTVGGTNPALVEALSQSCAVLAHDNVFNRWVAGEGSRYFSDESTCVEQLSVLLNDSTCVEEMKKFSARHFFKYFQMENCLKEYENLFVKILISH